MADTISLPLAWWIDLEFMPWWKAGLIFGACAIPIVLLGMRSLAGLGPARKWVAIGARLLVLLVIVLILGGARWQRLHKTVEVVVMRDISDSTLLYRNYPGRNLNEAVNDYLIGAANEKYRPNPDDRIGVISFGARPYVDSMPSTSLLLDSHSIREGEGGTDVASAIQLALATFQRDSMRRLVLMTDGNATAGDLEGALSAAVSQNVPIDVFKLSFAVQNEIIVDRVVAPSFKRETDAFDVAVSLISTNTAEVSGKLTLLEEGQRIEQAQITIPPANINAEGKIEPRKEVVRVKVPPLKSRGVRRFTAVFEPDVVNIRPGMGVAQGAPGATTGPGAGAAGAGGGAGASANSSGQSKPGDTLLQNNRASAFTFVRGQGKVLYVDNTRSNAAKTLIDALTAEGINITRVTVDQVPEELVLLQDYDAVVLHNVPRGRTTQGNSGLSEKHDQALAAYVHDFGGGLVMIGGPDSFGAGGWQGSKIEEVMPVNFDIPAQRQIPKGALVLIMHSCEMPDGNYWGEQCAIKAVETLSEQDDIGVISYGWQGAGAGGVGGSVWDYVLSPKGNGSRVVAAIKRMQLGDMPSFDDSMELAINGAGPGQPSLKTNNAAQKHVIIISDGDPAAPKAALIKQYQQAKVTISTVSVYPHGGVVPPTMQQIANATGGRYYGPINGNFNQLPQIFIKEATVVRRTLIQESDDPPIAVSLRPNTSDMMKGLPERIPPVTGLVLSSRKNNPTVEMPLVASLDGKKIDPLFAHWQAGLGKAAAYTSDATAIWNQQWVSGEFAAAYGKFWAQVVRGVSRPPMSTDYTVVTERVGDKAVVMIEAAGKEGGFQNFVSIGGSVLGPDGTQQNIRAVQVGPGTYKAEFDASQPGNYVVGLKYGGEKDGGWLASGLAVNESPELRELKSNDALLEEIARRTGGRVLPAWSAESANLFSRDGLKVSSSPLPVWDILLPMLLFLILLDVAVRRIAWDWNSMKKMAAASAAYVRTHTTTREVEAKPTLDALKRVREEVAETRLKPTETGLPSKRPEPVTAVDSSRKFEAGKGVEGDITQVVGGATSKPVPSAPKDPKPKGMQPTESGGHTSSLLEAKRRAQQKIKEKEQGE